MWQLPQAAFCEWGAGGGMPWQVPQAACAAAFAAEVAVQAGVWFVPFVAALGSVAPWQ